MDRMPEKLHRLREHGRSEDEKPDHGNERVHDDEPSRKRDLSQVMREQEEPAEGRDHEEHEGRRR